MTAGKDAGRRDTAAATAYVAMDNGTKNHALVRRMDAIETLAAVTDVCSDKTGTITLGKMVTRRVWVPAALEVFNVLVVGQDLALRVEWV
jgi:P-type E1-E2 ATPase